MRTPMSWLVSDVAGGRYLCGRASVLDEVLTVTTPCGRAKTAQIAGIDPWLTSKLLLRDLLAGADSSAQ